MTRDLAAAAASAVLASLAFPPADAGALVWVALVPLLVASRGASPARAALLGWVFGVVFLAILCAWLAVYSAAAPPAIALGTGLFYAAGLAVYPRRPGPLRAAAAFAAAEWARNLGPLGFTWGNLGYALWRDPVLIQAADVGGVFLLSAAVAWTNGALAEAIASTGHARRRALLLATAAPVALVVYAGLPRRHGLPHAGVPEAVLVQPCLLQGADWAADPARAWDALATATRGATRRPAALVIWPETVVRRYLDREPRLVHEIGALAAEVGAPILVGAPGTDADDRKFNAAFLVTGNGTVAGRYDKVHLVPVGEYVPFARLFGGAVERLSPEAPGDFTAADATAVIDLPLPAGSIRLGPLVCFEAAFGRLGRASVRAGADVLVAITNDGWSHADAAHVQHLATNVLRAVETRRWLLRCANTGISVAVDPTGRIHDSAPVWTSGAVRAPLVAPTARATLYLVLGDWPGPVGILILIAGWASNSSRRRSASTSPSSSRTTSTSAGRRRAANPRGTSSVSRPRPPTS